jgi:parvulin-like peptidyl-prolyl isomerase
VATVESTPITPAQLLQAWERRQRGVATNLSVAWVLADLVDEASAFEQARRRGFLDRPDVQHAVRQLIVAKYREAQQATNARPIEPSEADARAAYLANTNALVRPLSLNLAILLHEVPRKATPEKRDEARRVVEGWRAQIAAAPDAAAAFAALTAERSADTATRYRRGEVGWAGVDELQRRFPAEVLTAAQDLQPGGLSQPVETPQGFYLVRLLGRRAPEVRPFAEVEPLLRHRLREQNRLTREAEFRAEVRSNLDIRTNLDLLPTLVLTNRTAATNAPPTMPKG